MSIDNNNERINFVTECGGCAEPLRECICHLDSEWQKNLETTIESYKKAIEHDEPMDGDAVDEMIKDFSRYAQEHQGNK